MDNKQFKFKTNINCGGCRAVVRLHLDSVSSISDGTVDTESKNKLLTINQRTLLKMKHSKY